MSAVLMRVGKRLQREIVRHLLLPTDEELLMRAWNRKHAADQVEQRSRFDATLAKRFR